MNCLRTLSVLLLTLTAPARTGAAELRLFPGDFTLNGAGQQQQLLLVLLADGKVVAERTAAARFSSSAPGVAEVTPSGTVLARGDGEAVITATLDGQSARLKVQVRGTRTEATPSFRNQVIPILTRAGCNSGACHGALAGKGGLKLSLRGYDPETDHFVLTRQTLGRRVDRQEPAKSLLLRKAAMTVRHGGGLRLEAGSPDFNLLADWIAAGAPGPAARDARVTRLEVHPQASVLAPKDSLQIVVRAHYSDGLVRDVTRWAKFMSSEELTATVDADGKVTVAGHGEAAISAWFSDMVASAQVLSPYPNRLDPAVFKHARRVNFIDEHVLNKLQALRIPPGGDCTDAEFIRRLYLDTLGILPTPDEVTKFLADTSKDKRSRLIDRVLERTEFVDYWAYRWSDLLLISTRRLPQSGVSAFYQFVRQSVADDKPWDRFAREVLTAQGSTLRNGAANYFVLHRDVTDLTEATAVTFLGMSITCARCHNHPLEKWTQDQYWMMANLFSRVGLKNGDKAGETLVQALLEGDARHPRRGLALPPTPLDGKPMPLEARGDRRMYFAQWLTSKDNPYFARALVNRVWRSLLGRGLVEAEDDLRQTNPPSNAELLDALAKHFVENGFRIKPLIRQILNSATYQRTSVAIPANAGDDRFFSRYLVRRLSAEVILDAYSQVTGVPTPFTQVAVGTTGGFAPTKLYPLGTRALQLPDSGLVSAFLDAFGRPERMQTCSCERQQDSSVGQALHLNNGQTLNDKLRSKSSRVEDWLKEKISDEEAIKRVYLLALSRLPTDRELTRLKALLEEASRDNRREALEDLFWSVLTSKEFVFNH